MKTITVPFAPSGIEEIHRADGFVYYLASDSRSDEVLGDTYNRYVFKYGDAGQPVDVFTLRPAGAFTPNREVAIEGDHVYQLLISDTNTQVLQLSADIPQAGSAQIGTPPSGGESSTNVTTAAAALDRTSTLTRGVRVANLTWTWVKSRNGNINVVPLSLRAHVSQPSYLRGAAPSSRTIRGYPYAWGGYDSEWTVSAGATWSSFADGLSKGMYAGNVRDAGHGYISKTIGLDCSGYVSAVYRLGSKFGTRTLFDNEHFRRSTAKPVAGDIYNKPGSHVVIVMDRRTENGQWVLVVGESTTTSFAAGDDKVLHHIRKESSFSGYATGKYQNWST